MSRDDFFGADWYDRRRYHRARRTQTTLGRFGAYLRSRPVESWLFFAAGFVMAAILT